MQQLLRILIAAVLCVIFGVCPALPQQSPSSEVPARRLPTRVRVSHEVAEKLLRHKVKPEYPAEALRQRLEGTVVLRSIIDREGNPGEITVISGDPLLADAAIAALKQWRYEPYRLEGTRVEVDTTVRVNFSLRN